MPDPAWKNRTLVIIGHGSSRNPHSSQPTLNHGDEIRARNIFADVRTAFWKEQPYLGDILNDVHSETVYVVPNLACKGYITGEVIPEAMELTGAITIKQSAAGPQKIVLCDPVGTHPLIAEAIADRAAAITSRYKLSRNDTCLLLIGHGSTHNRQSSIETEQLAATLKQRAIAGECRCAFLEHSPLVENWHSSTDAKNVIVVPFMISNGLHGAEDIPALLGIDAADQKLQRMAKDGDPAGPYEIENKCLWYCRAIGSEDIVPTIIIDRVASAFPGGEKN